MLQALCVDARVRKWLGSQAEGRIHSVYSRACNLAWGEHLISLVLPAHGMVPGGVAVSEPAWQMRPGDPVYWDGAALAAPAQVIDLSRAELWENRPPVGTVHVREASLSQITAVALRLGRGELVGALLGGAPALGWSGYAAGRAGALLDALPAGDAPAVAAAVRPLVGLGEGLTPSCDDFLLGALAVLHYGGAPGFDTLAPAVAGLAAGTTPVSANFLRLAADGGFSERIEAAVLALLTGSAADAAAAATALIDSGHSSGTDSLVGIILAAGRVYL